MLKIFVLVFFAAFYGCLSESQLLSKLTEKNNNRQKRLLLYNGQGNLVSTNDLSNHIWQTSTHINPYDLAFLNIFLSPFRQTILGPTQIAYMIPVSDAVIQQINTDPVYQNKPFLLSSRHPVVKVDPLCAGKRAQIPSPNLCSNFLNCWDGWAFEQECPAGLLFSENGYCDYPYQVNCNNRKIKEYPEPHCTNDFEAYRSKEDCNEFFICVHSIPVRFKCPVDLVYNERIGVCDYNSVTECNVTKDSRTDISMTFTASSTAPSVQTMAYSTESLTKTSDISSSIQPEQQESDINKFNRLEFNAQSWSSTHVAFSRQDAIRQLNLDSMKNNS